MPTSTRERVEELAAKGLSVREIAHVLRVTTQNVYKHLKALDIDPASLAGSKVAS